MSAFQPLDPSEVVFGQYDGYTDLDQVDDHSTTDTLAAVRVWVNNDRWRGVPFVLRSGKRLADSKQLVTVIMRQPDGPFAELPRDASRLEISLSGSGELKMALVLKRPGPQLALTEHRIDLGLGDLPGGEPLPPYVALLHDVTIGDRSLFTSSDGLSHAWKAAEPILQAPRPRSAIHPAAGVPPQRMTSPRVTAGSPNRPDKRPDLPRSSMLPVRDYPEWYV